MITDTNSSISLPRYLLYLSKFLFFTYFNNVNYLSQLKLTLIKTPITKIGIHDLLKQAQYLILVAALTVCLIFIFLSFILLHSLYLKKSMRFIT